VELGAGGRRTERRGGAGGAAVARPVAGRGHVADARGSTHGARRALGICGTGRAGARTGLGRIADARRGAADRAGIAGRVLTGSVAAVAPIEGAGVAVVGTRGPARLLRIGRARLTRHAAARLGQVALARRSPAHRPARCDDIRGTALARPIAGLARITYIARSGATDEGVGPHAVWRAGGAAPRARFGYVAHVRGGATHGARIAGRMLAEIAAAATGVGRARVAVVGARRTARLERAIGSAARAGGAVRRTVVTLLASIDRTVTTGYVGDRDPDRVY